MIVTDALTNASHLGSVFFCAAGLSERPSFRHKQHEICLSGIGSTEERDILIKAGVTRILVDPTDLHNAKGMNAQAALDSGAYRASKTEQQLMSIAIVRVCRRT